MTLESHSPKQGSDHAGPSLMDRSISGMLWVALDKLGASGTNFVITVVLARLLFPEDFGLVAMAMVFLEVSSVFVESGFSTALIREKEISQADRSTAFLFNVTAAVLLYAALFACAPLIAGLYKVPALVPVIRVMGLGLIIDAATIVPSSALVQRVDMRARTLARLIAATLSGGIGVLLAWRGHGAWALVARMLVNSALLAVLLHRFDPWRPTFGFHRGSFKRLFGFGSRILATGLLDKFFSQAYRLVIGKVYAAATLGLYTQAGGFVSMAVNTLFRPVQTVAYPVLSKMRDDPSRLKDGHRLMLRMGSFIMFPVLVLLAVLAEPFIGSLIGTKWIAAAPYLRLLCVAGATMHVSTVNLTALLVLGRSDLSLRLEIIKKLNIVVAIVLALPHGVMGLVVGEAVVSVVNMLVDTWYTRGLLGWHPMEQIGDVLPSLLIAIIAGVVVLMAKMILTVSGPLALAALASIGIIAYVVPHVLLGTREWRTITGTLLPKALATVTHDRNTR